MDKLDMKKLLFFLSFILCVPFFAYAMTDNGDGTRTFAVGSGCDFTTLAEIIYVHPVGVTPGDSALLERGQTFSERLSVTDSGTSEQPITIGANGSGVAPIVNGADVTGSYIKIQGIQFVH
jgi:hypothetical protein